MDSVAEKLSFEEIEIARRALKAAIDGAFFPDWEFGTLIGVERNVVQEVYEAWPKRTVDRDEFACALIGSMNNLLGYPHGKEDELVSYVPEGRAALAKVLEHLISLNF